jgi:hypothetical protein
VNAEQARSLADGQLGNEPSAEMASCPRRCQPRFPHSAVHNWFGRHFGVRGLATRHRLRTNAGGDGLHPLDGARFLAGAGASRRLVGLVAHHSCAALEADLRGLVAELTEFDDEDGVVRDALWYCDITTSPDGEPVDVAERIAEIKHRYGPDHLVTRFISLATPDLLAAVDRTEQLLSRR